MHNDLEMLKHNATLLKNVKTGSKMTWIIKMTYVIICKNEIKFCSYNMNMKHLDWI